MYNTVLFHHNTVLCHHHLIAQLQWMELLEMPPILINMHLTMDHVSSYVVSDISIGMHTFFK